MHPSYWSFVLVLAFLTGIATTLAWSTATSAPQQLIPFAQGAPEQPSPSDTISESQIHVYHNGARINFEQEDDDWLVIIDLDDPSWSTFTDTNSMDPFIDQGANGIRIKTPCPESIREGDVITYKQAFGRVIHRVVHKDVDEQGPYFILKGDNNPTSDPGKVRCDQIEGKLVAVLY